MSDFLVNKLKNISKRKVISNIVTGNLGSEQGWRKGGILKNSDSILLYVRDYYETSLRNYDKGDVGLQTIFLDHISRGVLLPMDMKTLSKK